MMQLSVRRIVTALLALALAAVAGGVISNVASQQAANTPAPVQVADPGAGGSGGGG